LEVNVKKTCERIFAAILVLFGFSLLTVSVYAQEQGNTFVYTNNNDVPNTVTGFLVLPDGTLAMVPGSPFLTGGSGIGFNYASNTATAAIRKRFLYVSNSGTNDISGFSIDTTTGALTPVPASPFPTGGSGGIIGISLTVIPNGKFLYAGNGGSNDISVFSVGSNGALTPVTGSPFPAPGGSVDGIKVSPNGKLLGAAQPDTDSVAMFSIGSNGSLTSVPGSPFSQGGTGGGDSAAYVDMSCDSKKLFASIGNFTQTEVGVSTIGSNGALTPIAGSPLKFVPGINSNVGVLSPDNRRLFVSNQLSNTITSLDVEGNGGLAQMSGSPFADGAVDPNGMGTNAEGTLLYVANGDNSVTGFHIDNSNGSLSPVMGNPFITGGVGFLTSLTVFPAKRVEGEGDEIGDDGQKGHFRFEVERECAAGNGMEFAESDSGKGMTGSVDAYSVVGNSATITGSGALLDGTPVTYIAVATGNLPVIGANLFSISWITSTGSAFHTSGALTNGYIAVHP
jgi:6-phosphogluconolactonase